VSATDDLIENARRHAAEFDGTSLAAAPARKVAVVACMDARIIPTRLLGLDPGDAHVIRNAGGVVTDDTIRSLTISQRKLGTEEIVLVHHTECGLHGLDDDDFRRQLEHDAGVAPEWEAGGFDDLDAAVRSSIDRITASPFIPHKHSVRGFVYDVRTGALREVE
jgi:carbonic anhydrase